MSDTSTTATTSAATNALANAQSQVTNSKSTIAKDLNSFLTLLTSQLKNQDPLNPVDSTQFVSQLTAYSQLEQLIGINKNTTTLSTAVTPPVAPVASGTPATPSTSSSAMAAAAHALQTLL